MREVKKNIKLLPYTLLLPAIIIILSIFITPIIQAILLSFTETSLVSFREQKFVGLSNYINFFTSVDFSTTIKATLIFVIGNVFLTYVVGLTAALLLNLNLKPSILFRGIFILPWAVPQVVLAIVWKWMINPQYGIINYFLNIFSFGLIPKDISFLNNYKTALIVIIVITVWRQYPIACIMLLAGIKSIPNQLYEAAAVDGANSVKKFFYITLPGLRYVTAVLLLLLTIWSFGNFVIIWLMTQGGPADRTATLPIFSYINAFLFNKVGYGAAIGVLCLIISLTISILYYVFFMREGSND
jgi:multiple sugar transport system permease protein